MPINFEKLFNDKGQVITIVNDKVIIDTVCPFCKSKTPVTVFKSEYENWKSGMLIQQAMPTQSADTRELLITGICNKCFPSEE